jgi:hypothetical protein
MRRIALTTFCLLALCSPAILPAASFIKVGNFTINGVIESGGFILDDGNAYKPISKHQKANTHAWQLSDVIMLLRKKRTKRYIHVNTRTGENAKMRRVSL